MVWGALMATPRSGIDTQNTHRFSLMDCRPSFLALAEQRGLRVFLSWGLRNRVERVGA